MLKSLQKVPDRDSPFEYLYGPEWMNLAVFVNGCELSKVQTTYKLKTLTIPEGTLTTQLVEGHLNKLSLALRLVGIALRLQTKNKDIFKLEDSEESIINSFEDVN